MEAPRFFACYFVDVAPLVASRNSLSLSHRHKQTPAGLYSSNNKILVDKQTDLALHLIEFD